MLITFSQLRKRESTGRMINSAGVRNAIGLGTTLPGGCHQAENPKKGIEGKTPSFKKGTGTIHRVWLDLLIRSLVTLGASERELSRIIVTRRAV
jgi:hypothetical protein